MTAEGAPTREILGVNVAAVTVDQFIELMVAAARERRHWRVGYVNAASYNLIAADRRYAEAMRAADLLYADGQSVVWASRYLGRPLPERVNAGDCFDRFCEACARANLTLYLLGSRAGVAERAAQNLKERCPGLRIVHARDGHFEPALTDAIVAEINHFAPDFLIVGMGAPRQEFWTAERFDRLNVGVAWCVGALFEYLAGETPRAPVWVRKAGLEWLFRLIIEPRRLWRRYLIGNWTFLRRVLRSRRRTA